MKAIVIVGPTATGKSDMAVHLAKKFGGEVISADSRQVYKGLNIGTGKITKREMRGVRHSMLDVADPKKQYSAVKFAKDAKKAIETVLRRGKLPIIVGGTGFYIGTLLGTEQTSNVPPNPALRKKLSGTSAEQLFTMLRKLNPTRAASMNTSDKHNPRRLIRAIEISSAKISRQDLDMRAETPAPLYIGLTLPKNALQERIQKRLHKRIRSGMIDEARRLHARGLSWKRMDELGLEYRYLAKHLQGKISKDEMAALLNTAIWHYAKRQLTYFKRNKHIHWFVPKDTKRIETLVKKLTKDKARF